MTAEFADVSVGAAEGIEGWNTLIVRSERGQELVEAARKAGVIETDALPDESLNHLKGASLGSEGGHWRTSARSPAMTMTCFTWS